MKRLKILVVIVVVVGINLFFVFDPYQTYQRHGAGALFPAKDIPPYLLGISALAGLFWKKELGWVLTASLLYSVLIAGLMVPFEMELHLSAFAYAFAYTTILIPILCVHSAAVVHYYKLSPESGFLRRTVMAVAISTAVAVVSHLVR